MPVYDEKESDREEVETATSYAFKQKSRAEETIEREQREKARLGLLPKEYKQKFHMVRGEKHPYHPDGSGRYSALAVGFDGCFASGDNHRFGEYPKKDSKHGRNSFYIELHCHKPETYFKWINSSKFKEQ